QEGFEVDPPCAAEFLKLPNSDFFVRAAEKEKYQVDLWECNRQYLLDAGVLPEHITIGGVSTTENSDLIFSHRITQGQRGSNAAFLTLL
ncbi:MAG: laccase domain-containing protein, partial [Oscillospiraceae bacterium]